MITTQPKIHSNIQLAPIAVHEENVNGIEVSFVGGSHSPLVKLEMIFNAGTKYQSKPLVASIGFDLLREGHSKLEGEAFRNAINGLGVYYGMETTKDFGTLTFYVLERNLVELLKIIKGVFTSPSLSQSEFERLRQKLKNDYLIDCEKTNFVARQNFTSNMFLSTPYGVVAKLSDFDEVTYADVCSFMETFFIQNQFKMLVSGYVSQNIKTHIANFCNSLGYLSPMPSLVVSGFTNKKGLVKIKKEGEQSSIIMGCSIPKKGNVDDHLIGITNTILGGYFGSRLMQNIREDKGWTYGISSMMMTYQDTSILAIASDVLKDKGQATLDEIKKEFTRLKEELISDNELDVLTNYLKGKTIRSFDGAFEQADRYYSVKSFNLNWDYYFDYVKLLDNITPEMIQNTAKKYLKWEDFTIVQVGEY